MSESFKIFIKNMITGYLKTGKVSSPFIIWCDPDRNWKEILERVRDDSFELWSEDVHELVIRQRFLRERDIEKKRVIWFPVSRENLTYFKFFEPYAVEVIELSLISALEKYGLKIPGDEIGSLRGVIKDHILEWLDKPLSYWRDSFSRGKVMETLISDEFIFRTITGGEEKIEGSRKEIFKRRIVGDYGFPDPGGISISEWREKVLSCLLCTDADEKSPGDPPPEREKIIPSGDKRIKALKLLSLWTKDIELMESFERMSRQAEKSTSLFHWAKHVEKIPVALLSRIAEETFLDRELNLLNSAESFEETAEKMTEKREFYKEHEDSFWGKRAKDRVMWFLLVKYSYFANILKNNLKVYERWNKPEDGINWFIRDGWNINRHGDNIQREEIPGKFAEIRGLLKRTYLNFIDRVNQKFSELMGWGKEKGVLDYSGKIWTDKIKNRERSGGENFAILILDAFRYEMGMRLSEMLNEGEPEPRAEVYSACSPLPSITPLGMNYSLIGKPDDIEVRIEDGEWYVTCKEYSGNLSLAENRREYLKKVLKFSDKSFFHIDEIIGEKKDYAPKTTSGKIVITGDDFDDHDQKLKTFNPDEILKKYVRVIIKLRDRGYSAIVIVTDHGFYYRELEQNEILEKPRGDILWESRRAIVGRNLDHPTAIKVSVPGSSMDCIVPRSFNVFKTYGGLGFFHGGISLQEFIIPVVICKWSAKTKKVDVVLKPVTEITSLSPILEVEPTLPGQNLIPGFIPPDITSRRIIARIYDEKGERCIFKTVKEVTVKPGGDKETLELKHVEREILPRNSPLILRLIDADNEQVIETKKVILKAELDEWF